INQFENTDGPFVAMLIDLDGFKSVNDTYGHRTGDELLIMIARRIEQAAPAGSTLARIGGDEFVLFFPSLR
ncbi:MAG: GGDEF domain-containing protein, partial [Mesorhizobium sp.]